MNIGDCPYYFLLFYYFHKQIVVSNDFNRTVAHELGHLGSVSNSHGHAPISNDEAQLWANDLTAQMTSGLGDSDLEENLKLFLKSLATAGQDNFTFDPGQNPQDNIMYFSIIGGYRIHEKQRPW